MKIAEKYTNSFLNACQDIRIKRSTNSISLQIFQRALVIKFNAY